MVLTKSFAVAAVVTLSLEEAVVVGAVVLAVVGLAVLTTR